MSDHNLENIYNFLQLSDKIGTSGQPKWEDFYSLKSLGYEIIINLALSHSQNALNDEQKIVEILGMTYVHIPVVWEEPTLYDFHKFCQVMQDNSQKKVWVHCVANMRVSAFMYLYRIVGLRVSETEAKKDLEKIWKPNETWQKFIEKVLNDSPKT
ncbi:MAG: hypothetical protein RLZZ338_2634 [Cyanobacteriota bacterium]|jgi:protein tyrosine phosphatase (PTP) superfamily phosphohydrolase (DUF442 family)